MGTRWGKHLLGGQLERNLQKRHCDQAWTRGQVGHTIADRIMANVFHFQYWGHELWTGAGGRAPTSHLGGESHLYASMSWPRSRNQWGASIISKSKDGIAALACVKSKTTECQPDVVTGTSCVGEPKQVARGNEAAARQGDAVQDGRERGRTLSSGKAAVLELIPPSCALCSQEPKV